jgi:hypothetical protein
VAEVGRSWRNEDRDGFTGKVQRGGTQLAINYRYANLEELIIVTVDARSNKEQKTMFEEIRTITIRKLFIDTME